MHRCQCSSIDAAWRVQPGQALVTGTRLVVEAAISKPVGAEVVALPAQSRRRGAAGANRQSPPRAEAAAADARELASSANLWSRRHVEKCVLAPRERAPRSALLLLSPTRYCTHRHGWSRALHSVSRPPEAPTPTPIVLAGPAPTRRLVRIEIVGEVVVVVEAALVFVRAAEIVQVLILQALELLLAAGARATSAPSACISVVLALLRGVVTASAP